MAILAQSPFTLDEVIVALKNGDPPQSALIRQVSARGTNFHVDVVALEQLVGAGAKPELIEAIENPQPRQPSADSAPVDTLPVFSGEAVTGDEGPVTREHVFATLGSGGDQSLLAGMVAQYGIAFPYTPELGRELVEAGANAPLLSVIATATVGVPRLPEGFEVLPLAKARDFTGSPQSGRLDLRLYVDGAVEVRIQGERAIFKTLQAQPARDAGSETTGGFPSRPLKKLEVVKRDGRGQFVVIQRPSTENEFVMMLRIYDPKGGEDRHHLRITWEAEP